MKKTATITLILYTLMQFTHLYATVYTVNSTADNMTGSGTTGTLRYCITTLNADASTPHTVNFNITGTAPFTIPLSSDLPAIIKAGTIIDATTQNGYTTIPVVYINATGRTNGLYVNNVSGVKIYGLYIYGASTGIYITGDNADNFEIGAAGKGNYITRSGSLILIESADYGKIIGNHLGIHIDNNTTYVPPSGSGYLWGLVLDAPAGQDVNYNEIKDNFFGGIEYDAIQIQPTGWADYNVIQRNYFGTDAARTKNWVIGYCAIRMENARNNVFGADLGGVLTDGNIIGNTNMYSGGDPTAVGLWFTSSRLNRLRLNTYVCHMFSSPNGKALQLMGLGNDNVLTGSCSLAGTILTGSGAPANSTVDVYKSNPACSYCQGSQYVGTVIANSSGGWTYDMAGSGLQVGDGITFQVTSTTGNSSEFFNNNSTCSIVATTPLAIEKVMNNDHLLIYPNPANDIITIKTDNYQPGSTFCIYDLTGRKMMEGKLESQEIQVNIRELNAGFYLIKLIDLNSKTFMLIKQ